MACHIPPLICFSTINNISICVNNTDFTAVFFKAAYHTNLGAGRNFTESN